MPQKILIQLDSDAQPSTFDAVVAIDAGVDRLLQYCHIQADSVEPLVHGSMFTRGGSDLASTAIFIGGSDVGSGEKLLAAVNRCFFGPVRVSVLLDSNGCNTTAAAAVLTAQKHVSMEGCGVLVLGGTGPVGRRVARMLLGLGVHVRLASRRIDRAQATTEALLAASQSKGSIEPVEIVSPESIHRMTDGCSVLISAGAAGIPLLTTDLLNENHSLRVAIDLNAVPPLGIEGIKATDKGVVRGERIDYGALGVGGLKMKIHRAAIQKLFTSNVLVLDAEQVLEIGQQL